MLHKIQAGAIYKRPDGTFVYVGRTQPPINVEFWSDDEVYHTTPYKDTADWERQPYLRDLPNAVDPLLPYEFDLHWDVKRLSHLHAADEGVTDEHRDLATAYGFDLDDPDSVRAYNARYAVWCEANPLSGVLFALQASFPSLEWKVHTHITFYTLNQTVMVQYNDQRLRYKVWACGGLLDKTSAESLPELIGVLRGLGGCIRKVAEEIAQHFDASV